MKEIYHDFKYFARKLLAIPGRSGIQLYKALRTGFDGLETPRSPVFARYATRAAQAFLALPLPLLLLKYHAVSDKLYIAVPEIFLAMFLSNAYLNTAFPQLSGKHEVENTPRRRKARVRALQGNKGPR
ncbi:MAG: hypothetical protein PHY92_05700 [Alphaproteobacteria bacterium]|nr:hypothetical protein [Alphaproteobacteria bacterium]